MKLGVSLLLILITANPATANDCQALQDKCDKTVKACDKALNAKREALKLSDLALKKCAENSAGIAERSRQKDEELSAWYRNPLVIGILGFLGGAVSGLVIYRVTK